MKVNVYGKPQGGHTYAPVVPVFFDEFCYWGMIPDLRGTHDTAHMHAILSYMRIQKSIYRKPDMELHIVHPMPQQIKSSVRWGMES